MKTTIAMLAGLMGMAGALAAGEGRALANDAGMCLAAPAPHDFDVFS